MVAVLALLLLICIQLNLAIELKVESQCPYPIWLATLPNYGIPGLEQILVLVAV